MRRAGKVTGLGSGLVEAAKGFTLGLADAGRSVFEQPYLGAQKEVVPCFSGIDDREPRDFLKELLRGLQGCMPKAGEVYLSNG